jgi:hypothetical protein
MVDYNLSDRQEQAKPQISRWKEIIRIGPEINERETKTIQIINETKNVGSLKT